MMLKRRMCLVFAVVLALSSLTAGHGVPDALSGGIAEASHAEPAVSEKGPASTRSKGRALQPGDCIGIVAPASCPGKSRYNLAIKHLEDLGYRLKFGKSYTAEYGYFAGPDSLRASDINQFFQDDDVKAILCLRGGYGSARILDKLDYDEIARHPKPLIGYSDVTALHIALGERSHMTTVHGPMVCSFPDGVEQGTYTADMLLQGMKGTLYPGEIPLPKGKRLESVVPGEAEGVIMGGNLCVLASLIGTPYELKGDGALLLLEDVGETTYRVDRLLQQLWMSGLLHRVNGILLGDFMGAEKDYEDGDFHLEEVLDYYAKLSGKPVLKGMPCGHGRDNLYLPFGVHAVMRANEDGTASLTIDEDPLEASSRQDVRTRK